MAQETYDRLSPQDRLEKDLKLVLRALVEARYRAVRARKLLTEFPKVEVVEQTVDSCLSALAEMKPEVERLLESVSKLEQVSG